MKIYVCFKLLPEPDRILAEDFEKFSADRDLSYAGLDFSTFDSPALELGLRLKEALLEQGMEVSCGALTYGKPLPESFSLRLYSAGFDRVIRIPGQNGELHPRKTAQILSEAVKDGDVILTGREAGFGDSRMVPFYLAEMLGRPFYGEAENLLVQEGRIRLHCRKREGLYERIAKGPFVASVGNSPEVLRMSTLRQQLRFRGRQPEELICRDMLPGEQLPSFSVPQRDRSCILLDPQKEETYSLIRERFAAAKQQKARDWEPKELPQMLQTAVEEERLFLYPDREGGRILAVRKALSRNLPCFFGGELLALSEDRVTVQKEAFGGNLLLTREMALPCVLTGDYPGEEAPFEERLLEPASGENLENAEAVVICGNGMGSQEACREGRLLAKSLHAGFGLTRPGAMNGWGSTEEIIGQSGKILRPRICLVLGAAGAGAFMTGIQKSDLIIAVNRDPNALILKRADYGILTDAEDFIKRLLREGEDHEI